MGTPRRPATLADVPPVHGAVNRPLVTAHGGARSAARAVRRRPTTSPPRDAAAMQLCLLRETPRDGRHRGRDRAGPAGARLLPDPAGRQRRHPRPVAPRGRRAATSSPAFALSEPDAGSDAAALALEARPDGDGWTPARHEDLDLQRARRRRLLRLRPHDARRQRARRHRLRGGRRQPGPDRRAARHARPARPRHASTSTGCGSSATTCSARSTRASRWRCAPSTCSGRASARSRSGMAQAALDASLAWAQRARAVRRPPGRPAGRPSTRWPRWRRGSRPARLLVRRGGRGVRRRREPPSEITTSAAHGQAVRDRDRAVGRRPGASSCTARGACSGATCSSGSIVRCGRRGSTRAPPRCSARSSPADSMKGPRSERDYRAQRRGSPTTGSTSTSRSPTASPR